MFKTAAAVAALTVIISSSAMAQTLTKGQFLGVTQYTALYDPAGICGSLGLSVGQTSASVATVAGLGKTFTSVINNVGSGSTASPYGVSPITCSFPAIPKTGYTANPDGSYSISPTAPAVTTCTSSKGTFTLTSSNVAGGSLPSTNTTTIINNGTGNLDSGFELNTTNTILASSGTTLCYLSTSAIYLNTVK